MLYFALQFESASVLHAADITWNRDFVEAALGDDAENPLEKVYGGMILGNEGFVRGILQMLQETGVEGDEIADRKDCAED